MVRSLRLVSFFAPFLPLFPPALGPPASCYVLFSCLAQREIDKVGIFV